MDEKKDTIAKTTRPQKTLKGNKGDYRWLHLDTNKHETAKDFLLNEIWHFKWKFLTTKSRGKRANISIAKTVLLWYVWLEKLHK